LGSERIAFKEAKGSLEDDLDQALIAKDTVEAHTKTKTDQCQWEMKVFKFKKYNDGYEDGKRGAAPRYLLEVEAFFESRGLRRPAERGASAVEARISLIAPSGNTAPQRWVSHWVLLPRRRELPRMLQPAMLLPQRRVSPRVLPLSGPRLVAPPKARIF